MKKIITSLILLPLCMHAMEPNELKIVRSNYSDLSKHPLELKLEEQIMFEPMVTGLSDKEKEFLKAAWRLNYVEFKKKLDEGVSVNTCSEGGCALHLALQSKRTNYEILRTALERGINVNLTNGSQLSVLDSTISYMKHAYRPAIEKAQFAQFLSALLAKKARTTSEGRELQYYLADFNAHPELQSIVANHLKAQLTTGCIYNNGII